MLKEVGLLCVCEGERGGEAVANFLWNLVQWVMQVKVSPTLLPCCSVSSSAAVIEKTWQTNDTLLKREVMMSYPRDQHGRNSLLM